MPTDCSLRSHAHVVRYAIPVCCAWLALAQRADAQHDTPLFGARHHALTMHINSFAVDDANGDGTPDVLVRWLNDWFVGVADAQGEYELGAATSAPDSEAIGDLDRDGHTDLFSATSIGGGVVRLRIYLSNGQGGFHAPLESLVPGLTGFVEYQERGGDIDGDGDLDAFLRGVQGGIALLFGSGSGDLSGLTVVPCGAAQVAEAEVADFDQDGWPDFVVRTSNPAQVAVLTSTGPAAFGPPQAIEAAPFGDNLVCADTDLDGDLDLAFTNGYSVRHWTGDGQGAFFGGVDLQGLPMPPQPAGGLTTLLGTDVDADGDVDLAADPQAQLGWFETVAGSTPRPFAKLMSWWTEMRVERADLDADGTPEWIGIQGGAITVVESGHPTYENIYQGADSLHALARCDFDSDGRADFATLERPNDAAPYAIRALQGTHDGWTTADVAAVGTVSTTRLATADFNDDGHADIAVSTTGPTQPDRVHLEIGNGNCTFDPGGDTDAPHHTSWLAAADLDRDGAADVLTLDVQSGAGYVVRLQSLLGNGTGSLVIGPSSLVDTPTWQSEAELGDFDLDGVLDVLVQTSAIAKTFEVLRGDGAGAFGLGTTHEGAAGSFWTDRFRVADVNADGVIDVLATTAQSLQVCFGLGQASFTPPDYVYKGQGANDVRAADLDRDGALEVILDRGVMHAFRCVAGSWHSLGAFVGTGKLSSVPFADVDEDGDTDILTLQPEHARISLIPNVRAFPVGLATYGTGTPDCSGSIIAVANGSPHVGSTTFDLSWTNAPHTSIGVVALGRAADTAGSDPLGAGVLLHVDAQQIAMTHVITSDATGSAALALHIPPLPALVDLELHAQALWISAAWRSCSSSTLPWSSSTGLRIRFLP